MKCHNCGAEIPEKSIFCSICGVRVEQETETVIEPETSPVEPAADAKPIQFEPEPIQSEPVADAEPVQFEPEPVQFEPEPIQFEPEPIQFEPEPEAKPTEPYEEEIRTEGFVINHCQYCGAVLMNGANFCSNCGNAVMVYEQNIRKKGIGKGIIALLIAAAAAVVIMIGGMSVAMNCPDIKGEWAVESNNFSIFDMFNESYLDFEGDGTALYYDGFFTSKKYSYAYNRFTKVLTLKGSTESENTYLHVRWINNHTIFIRELNMVLYRIDDIPYMYNDDEYNEGDAVQF